MIAVQSSEALIIRHGNDNKAEMTRDDKLRVECDGVEQRISLNKILQYVRRIDIHILVGTNESEASVRILRLCGVKR